MFHAVLIFKCSECGKEIATDTKIKDDDIPIVPVNLNFMDGTIGFACPFCNYFNNIKMLSNDEVYKYKKIPRIGVV